MDRKELISIRLSLISKDYPVRNPPILVAVTKKRPLEDIEFAYVAGHRDFGENRVDELQEKAQFFFEAGFSDIRWHFIGHLQSNKLKKLFNIPGLSYIHSVDSFEILEKMYVKSNLLLDPVSFFLQVNTSGEKEKAGFEGQEELMRAANLIGAQANPRLKMCGLMTMSKIRTDNFERDAKACFKKLKQSRRNLQRDFDLPDLKLSMGMSSDYQWAMEEGADYIRVGSAIFKPEESR